MAIDIAPDALNAKGYIRVIDGFLRDIERQADAGPNARWLADNAAVIRAAHAEMLAERELSGGRAM